MFEYLKCKQRRPADIFGWCGVVRLVWLKRGPIDNTPESKGANVNDDLSATQVKKMFEVFEQTYGRRPVNQDEMVMWLKSSEYREAIRPHLDADGKIIA